MSVPYVWKDPKTGLYNIRHELPRREDDIDPKTGRPRRRRTTKRGAGKTEAAARKWHAVNVVAKVERGEFVDKTDDTVGSMMESWLRRKRLEVKPTTFIGYENSVRKHIIPVLGNVKLQALTPSRIEAFLVEKRERGHHQREGDPLADKTVRQIRVVLRMAMAEAVEKGKLPTNPVDKTRQGRFSRKTEREARRSRTFWTPAQVTAFLASVREHRLFVAFLVLLMVGLRRGELLGLRWQTVNLDDGTITINQTLLAPRYVMELSSPKSEDSERTISIDAGTVAALRAWRARQAEERLAFGAGWGNHALADDLVFTDEIGHPVKPALFSLAFKQAVKNAGLPEMRLHDARHTNAALLALSGVSPQVMQERLGHHSAAFTLSNYGGFYKEQERAAADAVADLIGTGGKA